MAELSIKYAQRCRTLWWTNKWMIFFAKWQVRVFRPKDAFTIEIRSGLKWAQHTQLCALEIVQNIHMVESKWECTAPIPTSTLLYVFEN